MFAAQANLAILKKEKPKNQKHLYRYLQYLPFLTIIFVCSTVAHTQEYIFKLTVDQFNIYWYRMTKNILPFYFKD